MGMSWTDYIKMPYSAAMAAREGYLIRIFKESANYRAIGWAVVCSFADPKDPHTPKSIEKYWPIDYIDNKRFEEPEDDTPGLAPEEILNLKHRLCRM